MSGDKPHLPAVEDSGAADTRSWDEFWAEIERAEAADRGETATTVIRGVRVPVPHDLPMRFTRHLERVSESEDLADVHALLADLFGSDVFDAWVDAGMRSIEFQTVLAWGIANGQGRPLTFAQAFEAVRTQGKSLRPEPANRTERRASARSGGPSKPTSPASTGSRRGR